jgi:hypothetical protein
MGLFLGLNRPSDMVELGDLRGSAIGKISIDRNPYYSVFWDARLDRLLID